MDRNQFIGIVLIFILLLGYTFLSAPSPEELEAEKVRRDSIENQKQELLESTLDQEPVQVAVPDSIKKVRQEATYGSYSDYTSGNEKLVTIENDLLTVVLSNKGGRIRDISLKNHSKMIIGEDGKRTKVPLHIMDDEKNSFDYILPAPGTANGSVRTGDLFFNSSKKGSSVSFEINTQDGGRIIQSYTLVPDSYKVDYDISFLGMQGTLGNADEVKLEWNTYLDKIEENSQFERNYTSVYYKVTSDDDSDRCSCTGDDTNELNEKVDWVSHVNQFFNTTLIAKDDPFTSAVVSTEILDPENEDLKFIKSEIGVPYSSTGNQEFNMEFYLGPNEFKRLRSYGISLEQIIPYGRSIFGTINRWLIRPFFEFLNQFIGSKGIVIIVLIFIIKMLLYPLTLKMLRSQAKMASLKPEINQLNEKFKDDAQKKQMESMKLYREYGVSPFGGCMPMIMQIPIWYALFRFFPAAITFRQESFLWAHDLSSFDVIATLPFTIPMFGAHISLFTVLWAITTVIYTYYNTKHMDMSANPAMKYVQYFMPIMFLVFFNNYASGLTCYMFFSNLINIIQTVVTKKYIFDDEKIRAELEVKKSKPKKKSGFQARLEEAMKQQQQQKNKKRR